MDILIAEQAEGPGIDRLRANYSVVSEPTLWRDPARLKLLAADARVLIIRNQTPVTTDLLEAAPHLIAIGRIGVGLDNIDVKTASALGVVVAAPLGANAASVADLTLSFILALARNIVPADAAARTGHWERKEFLGLELDGKILALSGFGRIGQLVARRAQGFGLRVRAYDPLVPDDAPIWTQLHVTRSETMEQAVAEADFVSVHLPLTPETRGMFGASLFSAMKRGGFFINTARGGIVNEAALIQALQSGHLRGAALDVREIEPPVQGILESLPRVILTPHIGAFTTEAQTRTIEAIASDVDRILQGEPALNFINFPKPRRKADAY